MGLKEFGVRDVGRSRASSRAASVLSNEHPNSAVDDQPLTISGSRRPSATSSHIGSPTKTNYGIQLSPYSNPSHSGAPSNHSASRLPFGVGHGRDSSFSSLSSTTSGGAAGFTMSTSQARSASRSRGNSPAVTRPNTPPQPIQPSSPTNKTPRSSTGALSSSSRTRPVTAAPPTPSRRGHQQSTGGSMANADMQLLEAVRALEVEAGVTPRIRHNSLAPVSSNAYPSSGTPPPPPPVPLVASSEHLPADV